MKKFIFLLMFLALQAFLVVLGGAYFWYSMPAAGTMEGVDFEVREGAGLSETSSELAKIGVLRWPFAMKIYAKFKHPGAVIKAGPYHFEAGILPYQILEKLLKGEVSTTQFTIPEGHNMWQVADRLVATFPHIKKETWLAEMRSSKYLAELPEGATTVEGYLYPETYTIRTKPTPPEVIRAMIHMFNKNFDEKWVLEAQSLNLSKHQLVTLASIIEKETGAPAERPHISSVFHNRLRLGMRLQTDPTIIYGIWETYNGNIRKRDLQTPTAYNTYLIDGLPPGPIANPGRAALEAAAQPVETKDLYFVATGAGGAHAFAATLAEHSKNVFKYQIQPFRNRAKK